MALTLRRWVGLLGVCCAALFAAFETSWGAFQDDSLAAEGRQLEWQLEEELAVLQARLHAAEASGRARAARSEGHSTFLYERPTSNESGLPFYQGCEVRQIESEGGVFDGLLSPASCLSPSGGQIRAEVFEFELDQAFWVQAELTASVTNNTSWGISLLDEDDRQIVRRSVALRGTRPLTISEWLEAGTYRVVIAGSYSGGGPFELGLDFVDVVNLELIAPETLTGGGRVARVEPWGRILPIQAPVYWVNGVGSVYQAGEWKTLPRLLKARDGDAVVASLLRDSVVVSPERGDRAGAFSPGDSVSGQLEPTRSPTVWDFAVRDSAHVAVAIEANSAVSLHVYDSAWELKAFGDQSLMVAVAPGDYHVVLGSVEESTTYGLWAGRCGEYFEAALGRSALPAGAVDGGCTTVRDVVTFELASNRVLSLEWSEEGEPVTSTIYDPEGAAWRMSGQTGVRAGRYNLVTAGRPTASLTILDHGRAETFLANRMQDEADSLRLRPSSATIGLLSLGDMHFPEEFPSRFRSSGQYRFLGENAEDPYCALVSTYTWVGSYFSDWDRELFGACWTYARFGAPGPRVAEWLRDGALVLAEARVVSTPVAAVVEGGTSTSRGEFGRFPDGQYEALPEVCRIGRLEMCEVAFLQVVDPSTSGYSRAVEETPLVYAYGSYTGLYYGRGRSIMADLVAEFGDESFEAFWTSESDVPDAFSAAFGIEVGEWMYSWTVSRFGTAPAPRDLTLLDIMVLLVFVALFGWGAAALHNRVEIGGQPQTPYQGLTF